MCSATLLPLIETIVVITVGQDFGTFNREPGLDIWLLQLVFVKVKLSLSERTHFGMREAVLEVVCF